MPQIIENSRRPNYELGQKFVFVQGQAVICNRQEGVVSAVLTGELEGMVEVRLERGEVCVSANYPDCYPKPEPRFILEPGHGRKTAWVVKDTYSSENEDPVQYHFSSKKKAESFIEGMIEEHGNWW